MGVRRIFVSVLVLVNVQDEEEENSVCLVLSAMGKTNKCTRGQGERVVVTAFHAHTQTSKKNVDAWRFCSSLVVS